jgi:hypothetical protein
MRTATLLADAGDHRGNFLSVVGGMAPTAFRHGA